MPWKPSDPFWKQGRSSFQHVIWWGVRECDAAGVPVADARKLQYALDMCETDDPFECNQQPDPAVAEACSCLHVLAWRIIVVHVLQAIEWQANKSPSEIIQAREEMISQIEFAASEIRSSGRKCFLVLCKLTLWPRVWL